MIDPEDDNPNADYVPGMGDPSDDDPSADGQFVTDPDDPDAETEDGTEDNLTDGDAEEEAVEDAEQDEHFRNLAEEIEPGRLKEYARNLLDHIEQDERDRKGRDEVYSEGLRRTGLGEEAPGGAQFEGATKVTHPVLTEVAVDFAAKSIKELFPANGPVKDSIVGIASKQKVDKAKRKTRYMNWQLTEQIPEFRSDLEQILSQTALAGATYLKMYQDDRLGRPRTEPVFMDKVLMPYGASSWQSAERKTHIQEITQLEFDRRVKSGQYRDIELGSPVDPEQTETEQANDTIEGQEPDGANLDGRRKIYEIACHLDIETDDEIRPYLVSIDESSSEVLSVYRNWEPDDETFAEMQWIVEFPFIPWRGAYPVGVVHLIGGLSIAATGALRALLDAAHITNIPTAIKIRGGSKGGQNIELVPGQITEIEGAVSNDFDIRKTIMPIPFPQPSAVLFQLLGMLSDTAKGVVQTALEKVADDNANVPVGTTLARIEQGMAVFSAIHARLHNSMRQVLAILHRLNSQHLHEEKVQMDTGEMMVRREDFQGPLDVIPVSDPNIFSEQQRFAQIQAVVARSDAKPGLYDPRKVEELLLERLRIPNGKDLLVPSPQPQHLNAVNENVAACMGKPIIAFPEQDHLAHIKTHIGFMQSKMFGMNMLIGPRSMPLLLNHMKDHFSLWYVSRVYDLTSQLANVDASQLIDTKDHDVTRMFDGLMAQVSDQVLKEAEDALGPFMPVLTQLMQMMQSMQPGPPQDPATAVAQAEVARKTAADQAKAQIDQQKLAIEQQDQQLEQVKIQQDAQQAQAHDQTEMQREEMREQAELQRVNLEVGAQMQRNTQDNQTALEISAAKIATGHSTNLVDGTGINPQPL